MKKIKYLLALCLILAAASAFAACGNNSNVADTSMVENTQRGGSAADDAGKDVIDGAGNAGKDVIDGAGDAGKDVIDGAKDAVDDAGNAVKKSVDGGNNN